MLTFLDEKQNSFVAVFGEWEVTHLLLVRKQTSRLLGRQHGGGMHSGLLYAGPNMEILGVRS